MKHKITFYHLFFAVILLGSIGFILFFVPPEHVLIVVLLIVLISFTTFYITALISPNPRTRLLAAAFVGVFLSMNAAAGFNILNTILLASFIIGLKLLLK